MVDQALTAVAMDRKTRSHSRAQYYPLPWLLRLVNELRKQRITVYGHTISVYTPQMETLQACRTLRVKVENLTRLEQ
ncbi:hypothetical protein M433DRAFT_146822 [Acidomyces richmondensis BFW]|nr:MAG: hypothetical protein FE78DRAFT_75017 [Acidomyces sp. 'richmondensis']KYG42405.1 hypothetical protein M433DRAFT_146822 [Acidomyces richmondensis BFW]